MRWSKVLTFIAIITGFGFGQKLCDLEFLNCPKDFQQKILSLSSDIVSIAPKIPFCIDQVVSRINVPMSLVIMIDNSSSMHAVDLQNTRFSETRKLLDKLQLVYPSLKVSLVVFTRRLLYDDQLNPYSKALFKDGIQHDAYIPLTALDTTFANGRRGIDTLKSFLQIDSLTMTLINGLNNNNKAQHLDARKNTQFLPDNIINGTDINLAFEAAKASLATSNATKEQQVLLLLTDDGVPKDMDTERSPPIIDIYEFRKGKATPTTFTISFTNDITERNPPTPIREMTLNIQNNKYSLANFQSKAWICNNLAGKLEQLFSQSMLPKFNPLTPKSMRLNGINTTQLSGESFDFGKVFPLPDDKTNINIQVTYTFSKQGILQELIDTTIFTLEKGSSSSLPKGLNKICRDPTLMGILSFSPLNSIAKPKTQASSVVNEHWTLLNPNVLEIQTLGKGKCCNTRTQPFTAEDSLEYVGLNLEMSREFSLEIKVYDHLGLFVDKVHLKVPRSEFLKLPVGHTLGSKAFRLLWNNRAENGNLAGTGVYIFKVQIYLEPLAGAVPASLDFVYRWGVIRSKN